MSFYWIYPSTNLFVSSFYTKIKSFNILVLFLKVIASFGRVDGGFAWFPIGRTHFAVLVRVLECFDQTQSLIHGSSDGKIVDSYLSHYSFGINDEQSSKSNSGSFQQNAVVGRNWFGQIGKDGKVYVTEASLLARCVHPSQMSEVWVDWNGHQFSIQLFELINSFTESDNFSGANECTRNDKRSVKIFHAKHDTYKSNG